MAPRPNATSPSLERCALGRLVGRRSGSAGAGPAILLLAATVVALLWANSAWRAGYGRLWGAGIRLELDGVGFHGDVRHLVNDGLMTLFFLGVGLEIKRELVEGALRHWRTAALPAIAAVGGMVVPALFFVAFNGGGPGARGWAVPVATDIAFAVGVLAVLGSRIPPGLKLFLLTLAVVDDVGAIVVIAVVYSSSVHLAPLLVAAVLLATAAVVDRSRLASMPLFVVLGVAAWLAVYQSGVHATLAGVALGLLAPAGQGTIAERVEHALAPVTSIVVLPLFALANAGVVLGAAALSAPGARSVVIGIVVGLVVGKVVGITGAAWVAVRAGVGALPEGVRWPHLVGAAAVAGIGFTVSVFVADLAFPDPRLQAAAKMGILAASVTASALGALLLGACRLSPRLAADDGRSSTNVQVSGPAA